MSNYRDRFGIPIGSYTPGLEQYEMLPYFTPQPTRELVTPDEPLDSALLTRLERRGWYCSDIRAEARLIFEPPYLPRQRMFFTHAFVRVRLQGGD